MELRLNRYNFSIRFTLSLLLFLVITSPLWSSQESLMFPRIESLNYSDLNYRQLQEDIKFYYRAEGAGKELPPLLFYSYKVTNGENIFSLASQAGLPYETVASLNRIPSSSTSLDGITVLLPSHAGVFFPTTPETDLEYIALSWRLKENSPVKELTIPAMKNESDSVRQSFYYFPGESFHDIERAFFLGILFSNPLPEGLVSSGYGLRQNPFTGHNKFHNGIDIAAPSGTAVFAAREGEIIGTGYNDIFGNYIEIQHEGGYKTFYGHLNKIFVELHSEVNSTMMIAEVGNTGRSTGPHLHFEIRRDGSARNPARLTPGLK